MPGPPPTPTNILKGRGSWRAKEPRRQNEPQPSADQVRMPAWLTKTAKTEWKRIAPILKQQGVLTDADVVALAVYCQAVADYRALTKRIGEHGYSEESARGVTVAADMKARSLAYAQLKEMGAKFGLSPSDRVGMATDKSEPKEEAKSPYSRPA